MNNRRCVVVAGADIKAYAYLKSILSTEDYFIYCDCGLRHQAELGFKPDLIVGDFDSHENPHLDLETIVLPCEKDDTDTMYGIKEGVKRGFKNFVIIGAIGNRLDHSLANLSILYYLDDLGIKAEIIDDYSDIGVVSNEGAIIPDSYKYFSLIALDNEVSGINIEHAKYNLVDGTITNAYQYGVSNEALKGENAQVSVKNGRLILIKDR